MFAAEVLVGSSETPNTIVFAARATGVSNWRRQSRKKKSSLPIWSPSGTSSLWKRGDPGDGRGRFDRLSEALKAYQTKNPGPKEFSIELPIYEHPGGFTRAWNEGAEHAKTLNLIRVWDPKQQMQIEQDWDG